MDVKKGEMAQGWKEDEIAPTSSRAVETVMIQDAEAPRGIAVEEEEPPLHTIKPASGWVSLDLPELWTYRELLYFLAWRDVKIRYKQTALGAVWAILQPFMQMVVFTVFFGHLGGFGARTGGIPYPIFVFAGLLPWTFFSNSVTSSGNSLVGSANLISKVYFPRIVVPLASVGAGLVDFAISSVVLLGMMAYYRFPVHWQFMLVPLFLIATILAATGVGFFLSALTVAYRDFIYIVPFGIQIWMFVSPVIYPPAIVPVRWRWVLALNPMTGLIDGFRSSFLGTPFEWTSIVISLVLTIMVFCAGALYFKKVERRFADIV